MFIPSIHQYLRNARRRPGPRDLNGARGPKRYERMEQFPLPEPLELNISLADALKKRTSQRTFGITPLTPTDISSLLFYGAHKSEAHRPYPSGGGYYPIELYVITLHTNEQEGNVLHYEPDTHILRRLWNLPKESDARTFITMNEGWDETVPSALIVLTAVWERTQKTYKDFAYILSLLEAGHLAQNILLVSGALSLNACPLGGFNDEKIIELLDLNPLQEQPLYLLTVGNPL